MRPDLGYSVNLHKSKSIQTDEANDKLQDWEMLTSGHVSDQPQPPVRDPLSRNLEAEKKNCIWRDLIFMMLEPVLGEDSDPVIEVC